MDTKIFEEIYLTWATARKEEINWDSLAQKYNVQSGEVLRNRFKRHRRKLGLGKTEVQEKRYEVNVPLKSPKILIFDLENSFLEIASWGINKQYLNKEQILHDWYLLSYSAKWLYDENVYSSVLTSEEAIQRNDKRICGEMRNLLDIADIAITYNGNLFDIPKINTRMLINGFSPPSSYKSIDVYQTIARVFGFTNNSLDYVNQLLDLERKLKTDFQLWKDCVAGNEQSLRLMEKYNQQDVWCLEATYLKIRPWIRNHPNIGLWHDSIEPCCGFCGSMEIEWISNLYPTPVGLFKSFRCLKCGGVGRSAENTVNAKERKILLRNT